MPTIHRERGLRFVINTEDHRPPHVHVLKAGGAVRVELGDDDTAPSVMQSRGRGLNHKDARRAIEIVEREQEEFLNHWRRYYGQS